MSRSRELEPLGETDLALESLRDAVRFSGGNSKPIALTGYILAKTGRTSAGREVLRKLDADYRADQRFAALLARCGFAR